MPRHEADNFFDTTHGADGGGYTQSRFLVEVVTALEREGYLPTSHAVAPASELARERRMGTVHFYAYANGLFSARQLAASLHTDRVLAELAGGETPSFQEILAFRDVSNETLAFFFTELLLAMADCGFETVLQTPLHAITSESSRLPRARAAAELAVTLLNAAKRRDDIETARYGGSRRGDELPVSLRSANERQHRIRAMLRLRGADSLGSDWDEPTQLIDLSGEAPSHAESMAAARDATRPKLLDRMRTDEWDVVDAETPVGGTDYPHAELDGAGTRPPAAEDAARIERAASHITGAPLAVPTPVAPPVRPAPLPGRAIALGIAALVVLALVLVLIR